MWWKWIARLLKLGLLVALWVTLGYLAVIVVGALLIVVIGMWQADSYWDALLG